MVEYVIDASAVLRYVDNEPGAERVEEILTEGVSGNARICISAVQWGEVAGRLRAHHGAQQEMRILSELLPTEVEIVAITGDRAVRAADLKVDRKISYADAFALELATQSPNHILVTADYGFKAVDDLVRIEFLPSK
jgi:ribonuclease VapC